MNNLRLVAPRKEKEIFLCSTCWPQQANSVTYLRADSDRDAAETYVRMTTLLVDAPTHQTITVYVAKSHIDLLGVYKVTLLVQIQVGEE